MQLPLPLVPSITTSLHRHCIMYLSRCNVAVIAFTSSLIPVYRLRGISIANVVKGKR